MHRSSEYESAIVRVGELSHDTVRVMATLYLDNYDGSSEALFREDLVDKDEAVLLYHDRALVGFTTLKLYEVVWRGVLVHIVYSGDTIVSPQHWGQQELAFAWINRIGQLKRTAPSVPLYWFLLVKGHRTFKYLSVFGKSFYPHWQFDRGDLKPLADQLATAKFGSTYNPVTGVVEFEESHGHLKERIACPTREEMIKPATQFFLRSNPGYRQGHELVCICELELFNMKPLTARVFRRALEESVYA
jgi:hypothetical protein